jgi:lipoyl(octanoyl) transferase
MNYKTNYPRWRLLPAGAANGSSNMALDQALLDTACKAGFLPTIRFYRWNPPALSIGRFQKTNQIDLDACGASGIDLVRRPTGGKSILHLDDFTYSLILPPGFDLPSVVVEAYALICGGILTSLRSLGLNVTIQAGSYGQYPQREGACFSVSTQADLEYLGRKICGSAQVRRGGAVLQHGSILLKNHSELQFNLLRFEDERHKMKALVDYKERCITMNETGFNYTWDDLAYSFREGFSEFFGATIEEGCLLQWEESRWRDLMIVYNSQRWLINAQYDELPPSNRIGRQLPA